MIDPEIKQLLGFAPDAGDVEVREAWNRRIRGVYKPCWELKYCPYGPLVEEFPLPQIARAEMEAHNEMLRKQLDAGIEDPERHARVQEMLSGFLPEDYPVDADAFGEDQACSVFGHYCPVFFVNEPLTETQELRRVGRHIPRPIMLRMVRRDNSQCQVCGKALLDDEIEFDHVIPLSKGGSSEEHNLRVACFDCNRAKSNEYRP